MLCAALREHKAGLLHHLAAPSPPRAVTSEQVIDGRLLGELFALDPTHWDALDGPDHTPWGTLAWSDPSAPALAVFGPPPEPRSTTSTTSTRSDTSHERTRA